MLDPIDQIDNLLGQAFDDAPRQLKASINLSRTALAKKRSGQKTCGEALNYLRRAQKLVDEQNLQSWQAELHAAWAIYYFYECPNLEGDGLDENRAMFVHIREAQRLEPDNELLQQLIAQMKR